jgi:hypothetical protein
VVLWSALAIVGLGVILRLELPVAGHPWDNDAFGFWRAWSAGLYSLPWLAHGAYVYSPAFAQLILPWTLVAWGAAWAIWVALQVAALVGLLGPFPAAVALKFLWPSLPSYGNAVHATINNGNPQLLIAAAITLGMRWPAAWAFVILTKVTPGIGILWFAVRRDWKAFWTSLGVTAAIAAISFAIAPRLWVDWAHLLGQAITANTLQKEPILPLPFLARLPIALAVLLVGALTNRRWTVPVACCLALPAIQLGGFAILVAALPLWLFDAGLGWTLWPWLRPAWAAPPPRVGAPAC